MNKSFGDGNEIKPILKIEDDVFGIQMRPLTRGKIFFCKGAKRGRRLTKGMRVQLEYKSKSGI